MARPVAAISRGGEKAALNEGEDHMSQEIDALRAAMRAAQVNGRGLYIGNGTHILNVDKALCKRTLIQGNWKETWIVEFKVAASSAADHEVGQTRSYVENPQNAGWMDRFKGALVAICGIDMGTRKLTAEEEDTIGNIFVALRYDEERVRLGWPENFLKGRQVVCEGSDGKSLKGISVTNKKWSPYVAAPAAAGA